MSSVNSIVTTNLAPAGYTAGGIMENLSKVLKELYPAKADKMMAEGMITEEQLFAAFAFGELEKKAPKIAKAVLSDLKEQFKALKQGGDIRPLFHAMEKAINNTVARGKISSQEGANMIKTAMGMAQLDGKTQWLSARRIKFEDQGSVPAGTTYMDRILAKIADNTAFSAEDLKVAEKRMADLDAKGVTYAPLKNREIKVVHEGAVTPGGATGTTTGSTNVTETTIPVADGSEQTFLADQFGYQPVSAADGNMMIQIPANRALGAVKVEILSSSDNSVIASADVNIQLSNGAKRARFGKKGHEYGDKFNIKISWSDGSTYERTIDDSSKVVKRYISL